MLRTVLRAHHLPPAIHPLPRSLVSSVLLTRTYENESVAELKKIAKDRGLSPFVQPFPRSDFVLIIFLAGRETSLPWSPVSKSTSSIKLSRLYLLPRIHLSYKLDMPRLPRWLHQDLRHPVPYRVSHKLRSIQVACA